MSATSMSVDKCRTAHARSCSDLIGCQQFDPDSGTWLEHDFCKGPDVSNLLLPRRLSDVERKLIAAV